MNMYDRKSARFSYLNLYIAPPLPMGTLSPPADGSCKNTRKRKLIDAVNHSNNASVFIAYKNGDGAEENVPEDPGRVWRAQDASIN